MVAVSREEWHEKFYSDFAEADTTLLFNIFTDSLDILTTKLCLRHKDNCVSPYLASFFDILNLFSNLCSTICKLHKPFKTSEDHKSGFLFTTDKKPLKESIIAIKVSTQNVFWKQFLSTDK